MVQFAASRPLVAAMHAHNDDLLGSLAHDARAQALLDTLGPVAIVLAVLPV